MPWYHVPVLGHPMKFWPPLHQLQCHHCILPNWTFPVRPVNDPDRNWNIDNCSNHLYYNFEWQCVLFQHWWLLERMQSLDWLFWHKYGIKSFSFIFKKQMTHRHLLGRLFRKMCLLKIDFGHGHCSYANCLEHSSVIKRRSISNKYCSSIYAINDKLTQSFLCTMGDSVLAVEWGLTAGN